MIVGLCRGLVLAVSAVVPSMRRFVRRYMSYQSATDLFVVPARGRLVALAFCRGTNLVGRYTRDKTEETSFGREKSKLERLLQC